AFGTPLASRRSTGTDEPTRAHRAASTTGGTVMMNRVITATTIVMLVLGLGVLDRAAALPMERLINDDPGGDPTPSTPSTPTPPPGALIIVGAGDSFASGQGAADHTSLISAASWGGTNDDGAAV